MVSCFFFFFIRYLLFKLDINYERIQKGRIIDLFGFSTISTQVIIISFIFCGVLKTIKAFEFN